MKLLNRLLLTCFFVLGILATASAQSTMPLAAVYGESEPYYSSSLPGYGYYGRIVSAAFAASGYSVDFHTDNWSRAIRDTAEARYDVLAGGWSTEARKEVFLISNPYALNRIVFIKRKDASIQKIDLADPKGLRFSLVRNSYTSELIVTPDPLDTLLVADSMTVLRMVLRQRVDVGALEERTAISLIKNHFSDNGETLDLLPQTAAEAATSIMVSRQHPNAERIVNAFNEGLKRLMESGEYAKLLKGSGLETTMIDHAQ